MLIPVRTIPTFKDMRVLYQKISWIFERKLLINIPAGLLTSWFASSMIIFLLSSLIFEKVLK